MRKSEVKAANIISSQRNKLILDTERVRKTAMRDRKQPCKAPVKGRVHTRHQQEQGPARVR